MKLGTLSLTVGVPITLIVAAWVKRRTIFYRKINCEEVVHLPRRFKRHGNLADFDYACKKCWAKESKKILLVNKMKSKGHITASMLFCDNCNSFYHYPETNVLHMKGDILGGDMEYHHICTKHVQTNVSGEFFNTEDIAGFISEEK